MLNLNRVIEHQLGLWCQYSKLMLLFNKIYRRILQKLKCILFHLQILLNISWKLTLINFCIYIYQCQHRWNWIFQCKRSSLAIRGWPKRVTWCQWKFVKKPTKTSPLWSRSFAGFCSVHCDSKFSDQNSQKWSTLKKPWSTYILKSSFVGRVVLTCCPCGLNRISSKAQLSSWSARSCSLSISATDYMFSRVTSELQDSSQQRRLLNQTTRFFLCLNKTNESSAEAAAILFWRDKHSSPVFNAKTVRGLGTSHCNALAFLRPSKS